MKVFLLLTIFSIVPICPTNYTPTIWYGRVFDSNVYFYSLPQDNSEQFIIEPSYFVQLTADFNSTFYKAKYMNIEGFVKKKDVQVTSNKIAKPFLENVYFRVYLSQSQTMYSSPNTHSNIIKEIPLYTKNVCYLGSIIGETVIKERSNEWYYCKYTLDKTYYGYVYSEGIDQMSKINKNTEECEYVEYADFSIQNNQLTVIPQDSNSYNLVVIFVILAVGVFVIMIIKGKSILENKKNKEVTNFLEN